ncbi:amino acid adenylation domain-containing protein [Actinocrinis puniceicyclus]|uniref:Amino acid adenylation domain-containing protein n=1 Tax=Actinocrinis puniceicyclus TaxID=977794 RepID=A0A8J8BFD0_9ACTN|nr:amino acid adenylation domain-containing protein [Actinocrinis puniceicyclus]MBS2966520.1 amino acid adenylation domain-containing protein [Actinocrinis puniceicyclus]
MTTTLRPYSTLGDDWDAADSSPAPAAFRRGAEPAAVTASACLIVAARMSGAAAVEGTLTDPGSGRTLSIALPWRAPLRAVVERVGAAMTDLPDCASLAVGSGPVWFKWRSGRLVADQAAGGLDAALLAARLDPVLAAILDEPELPAGRVRLWSAEDERIVASAHTPAPGITGTIAELVHERIAHCGGQVAIEDGGLLLTYAKLGELVSVRARRLAGAGVSAGDVVGVGMSRGTGLVATLLALWSLGAAFLPFDPDHPRLRTEAALGAAGAKLALTDDEFGALEPSGPATGDLCTPRPEELAYAMTTSGSTGQPKVVGVPHGALWHCVQSFARLLDTPAPRVAWTTALTFDISMLELMLPLAAGGRLLVADAVTRRDPGTLAAWLSEQAPDIVQATPTAWRMLLPALRSRLDGTVLLCGGEALTADLAADLVATGAQVWNVYGPTEATIWCTANRLAAPFTDPVSIGRPLPGVVAAVLDRQGRPVEVGQAGELYLGGTQLAVGYLGDRERTAAAFGSTVFSAAASPPLEGAGRERAYRTGDLCAWRPDGTLEYRGRADHQVKLRGHRIELEEIEAHAERHPAVARAAAVLVERERADQRLFLYYQPQAGSSATETQLRAHLGRWLPAAVLPQHVTALARLPLTPNQKVDRRVLREAAAAVLNPRPADGEETS